MSFHFWKSDNFFKNEQWELFDDYDKINNTHVKKCRDLFNKYKSRNSNTLKRMERERRIIERNGF